MQLLHKEVPTNLEVQTQNLLLWGDHLTTVSLYDSFSLMWLYYKRVPSLSKSVKQTKNVCSCEPLLCTWIISRGRKQNKDNWCKTCSLYLKWLWPNSWLLVDFLHQNDPGQWSLVANIGCCVCFFPQLFSQLGTVESVCSFASKLNINITTLKHHHHLMKWGK